MILLAGDYKTTEGARSRNGGPGAMTVSTAVGRVLTGSSPRSLFGSFLVIQKGTRPAGRNPLRITYPCRHNPAASYIQ